MPKVSIIVPVYNVAPYLRQCLDSVVNQTLRDIEIICVDDGSTDGSAAILAEYAAKDPRVKVLTREHTNAGAARNAGMAVATGEYLGFVDSDDFVEPEAFERMAACADRHSAEVVCTGKHFYNANLGKITRTEMLPVSMCEAEQPRSAMQDGSRLVPICGVSVWNKLFSRTYVSRLELRFQGLERANDLSFVALALILAERICFMREAYYCYRVGRVDGLQSGNSRTPLCFAEALLEIRHRLETLGRYESHRVAFANLALAHSRYNLLSQTQEEPFRMLYGSLHDRLLSEFDVDSLKEDEFLYPADRVIYEYIRDNASPYPLMLRMMRERNDRGGELMAQKAKAVKLQKDLTAAKDELARTETQFSKKVEILQEQIMKQKAEAGSLQRDLAASKEELARTETQFSKKVEILQEQIMKQNAETERLSVAIERKQQEISALEGKVMLRPVLCSVVMAVYNAEEFLEEAVQSILKQDIGRENLQLILVDDGSIDRSGELCDRFAAKYPAVITVVHQENTGVASARNAGLKLALGKYVTFTDSDDKLTPNTCRLACAFLDSHEGEVDIVAIPLYFFDAATNPHILNYKFDKGTRVIDLEKEWTCPQLSMSASFVRTDLARKFGFDERLAYAEDAKCALKISGLKRRLGVVSTARYLYRKRAAGSSAIQNSVRRLNWYIPVMKYFHLEILEEFRSTYGEVPRFVQFACMYDLQWRIKIPVVPRDFLGDEVAAEYKDLLRKAVSCIEVPVICAQRHIGSDVKLLSCSMRENGSALKLAPTRTDINLCYDDCVVTKLSYLNVRIEFVAFKGDCLEIEGSMPAWVVAGMPRINLVARAYPPCDLQLSSVNRASERTAMDQVVFKDNGFKMSVPLVRGKVCKIVFGAQMEGLEPIALIKELTFGPHSPVSNCFRKSYWTSGDWMLTIKERHQIFVEPLTLGKHVRRELSLCRELWRSSYLGARKAVLARMVYRVLRLFKRKPLILFSDRFGRADDNGEAMYKYVCAQKKRRFNAKFIISKGSPDYARVRRIGPVVDALSYAHKMSHLLCDMIVSSQADGIVVNPFFGHAEPYRDLLVHTGFVFLQHGITLHNLSGWLNRWSKNIQGFVTVVKPEWKSIQGDDYGYSEDRVWLTGFPRYDRLYHAEENCILLLPTWRRYVVGSFDPASSTWTPCDNFTETDYFKFYNGLINHPRLMAACRKANYKILFVPHPNLKQHSVFFDRNDIVEIADADLSYRDAYAKAKIAVTDYSSAIFDFAYLLKPVVYTQFDSDMFYSGMHTLKKGYFDYARDGFGEVETTLEGTVDRLVEYIEAGCRMKPQYEARVKSFFLYHDNENSRRVYERICDIEKIKTGK